MKELKVGGYTYTDDYFRYRLVNELEHFNKDNALTLSMQIHEAESLGLTLSISTDILWGRLTKKILTHK